MKKASRKIQIILQGLNIYFCFNIGNALLFTMTKVLLSPFVCACVCICVFGTHTRTCIHTHKHILVCKSMCMLRGPKLTVFTLFSLTFLYTILENPMRSDSHVSRGETFWGLEQVKTEDEALKWVLWLRSTIPASGSLRQRNHLSRIAWTLTTELVSDTALLHSLAVTA